MDQGSMYRCNRPKLHVDIDAQYGEFKGAMRNTSEANAMETLISYFKKLGELDDETR
jgi:hypothetical protein